MYDSWLDSCPLSYTSPNAPSKRDVLGTWQLAILAGHNRYAHMTALRGDAVSAQILGMKKIISEDALRHSLSRMSPQQSQEWLGPQPMGSVQAALSTSWILGIDTTIKPFYGKQSGAEVSHTPHKPGRPSHALHTYWVGSLRLVLDVVVLPVKSTARPKRDQISSACWTNPRPSSALPWSEETAALATSLSSLSWGIAPSPTCSSCAKAKGLV